MTITFQKRVGLWHPMALLLTPLLTLTVFTSGGSAKSIAALPLIDTTPGAIIYNPPAADSPHLDKGITNKQKLVLLGGAAALYYLYNSHKNAQAKEGQNGQYYLSKNGRVYYRDAQRRAHFVTPPSGGIQVPASEAQHYSDFQGYNNRSTGRDLTGLGAAPAPGQ